MKAKKVSALLVATAMVCGIAGGTTAVHADPEYTINSVQSRQTVIRLTKAATNGLS